MYIVSIAAIQRKFIKGTGYTLTRAEATRYPDCAVALAAARSCSYRMKSITIIKVVNNA